MKKIDILIPIILLFIFHNLYSQKIKTDANIVGHVTSEGKHLLYASVSLKGTSIGTLTDQTGHYQLINLPTGEYTLSVSNMGFKPQEQRVSLETGKTIEIKFDLEKDVMNINEVVVSADRAEQKRKDATLIVNTISEKIFDISQSVTLGESLNFSPGLRLENNCQNCGFSQVYGLELIPTNMIEKVEVVRGGGSALFGSNAIAGTINLILKDPKVNSYEIGSNYSLTGLGVEGSGGVASAYSVNLNTSVVSNDQKTGVSLYGFSRNGNLFDANNDGFSEISPIENLTIGARVFHRIGYRDKLAIDFFTINEERNGGNKQEYPLHERDIAEALTHNMQVAGISYERFFRDYDLLSVYASGQFLERDSYYGAGKSLSDYGHSKDNSIHAGVQYKANFGKSCLIAGVESTADYLIDQKLGYSVYSIVNDTSIEISHTDNTIVTDQSSVTSGIFAQYELKLTKLKIATGIRFDHYKISDQAPGGQTNSGNVLSPRVSIMYDILSDLKFRLSYSQGYRAPQVFDEDLHIETSGSRRVIHVNAPDLRQETSHSLMTSFDYNRLIGTVSTAFLFESFYTKLFNAFANSYGIPDEMGTVIYTRINSEAGAVVRGINMELKLKPLGKFFFSSGFTIQTSEFEVAQDDFNEKSFFRTPNHYGFFAFDWDFYKSICFSSTANYTGKMLTPYFGPENPDGELRNSNPFFDLGAKISYTKKINDISIEFSTGIKNIFNSYQNDFDRGMDRDPAYIYGPVSPRKIYFGIKFGNLL